MKNKMMFLVLLTTFLFSLAFISAHPGFSSANITIVAPSTGAIVSNLGYLTINATFSADPGSKWNYTYVYLSSSSTANSSWVLISSFHNESQISTNGSLNVSGFEDASDYLLNISISNGSDTGSKTVTIVMDNTKPMIPKSLSPATLTSNSTKGTMTFSSTVANNETTACTYRIYRGGNPSDGTSGTGTYSASTCSFTKAFSTSSDNGVWFWTVTASDGKNTTESAETKYNVAIPAGNGGIPLTTSGAVAVGTTSGGNGKMWGIIIGAIVLIGFGYWLFKK